MTDWQNNAVLERSSHMCNLEGGAGGDLVAFGLTVTCFAVAVLAELFVARIVCFQGRRVQRAVVCRASPYPAAFLISYSLILDFLFMPPSINIIM